MTANTDPVRIEGIQEVSRALRNISKDAAKELRTGFKQIAESVASDVRGKVPSRSGKAARSIKAKGSNKGAAISFGGRAAEYYPFLDFGNQVRGGKGKVGRGDSVPRPFVPEGRYVYPTIGEHKEEIGRKAEELLADLARKHELEAD